MRFMLDWSIVGVVASKRELRAKKDNSIFRRILKVDTLGASIEVMVEERDFNKWREGDAIAGVGTFEFYNGIPQFKAVSVCEAEKVSDPRDAGDPSKHKTAKAA